MQRREGGRRTRGELKYTSSDMPLVSIITVVYNGRDHLEQTIRSVLTQDYPNIEHLVIDGGSVDGTLEVIGGYDHAIDYWISEPDNGIYDAMNKGVRLAKGELVGILNADDYYLEGAVGKVVRASVSRPDAELFHGDMNVQRSNGIIETWHSREHLGNADAYHMPVNHPTVFVRAACYRKYGIFDTRYRTAADFDLILRYLFRHRATSCYLNEPLAFMREGGRSSRYSTTTYREAIDIVSAGGFSLFTRVRLRIWYLWLMLLQSSKKYRAGRFLSSLYYRIKFRASKA